MVFNWNLSDSKSLQVSRTLFSILVDLSITVIWMVLVCPSISSSSSPLTKSLRTVLSAPIIIVITLTFITFFSFLARSKYLSIFFVFHSVVCQDSKVHDSTGSFFVVVVVYYYHHHHSMQAVHTRFNLCFLSEFWATANLFWFRTLLADLKFALVWILPLISSFFSLFSRSLWTIPRTPIIIIKLLWKFHSQSLYILKLFCLEKYLYKVLFTLIFFFSISFFKLFLKPQKWLKSLFLIWAICWGL